MIVLPVASQDIPAGDVQLAPESTRSSVGKVTFISSVDSTFEYSVKSSYKLKDVSAPFVPLPVRVIVDASKEFGVLIVTVPPQCVSKATPPEFLTVIKKSLQSEVARGLIIRSKVKFIVSPIEFVPSRAVDSAVNYSVETILSLVSIML